MGRCSMTLGRPAAPGCFGVPSVLLAKTAHGRYALACPASSPGCFGALRSFSQRQRRGRRCAARSGVVARRRGADVAIWGGVGDGAPSADAWGGALRSAGRPRRTRLLRRSAELLATTERFVAGCLLTRGAWNFIVNTVCDAIAGACLLLGCSVLGGFRRLVVGRGCG